MLLSVFPTATGTGEGGEGEFEALLRGGFSRERLTTFFSKRPLLVARRLGEIAKHFLHVRRVWASPEAAGRRGHELRNSLQQLGPLFVKIGQTLAQRADLVGEEAAAELKLLQAHAQPFPNELAYRIIAEDLGHRGPLAPDVAPEGCDTSLPPLFASFSAHPLAAASLGQVYQARTHDGRLLAVKVQRPGVARAVALDWACLYLGTKLYKTARASYNDFSVVADQIASGVFLELDYHHEARNAEEFVDLHKWLGFVTAPRWVPEYTGPRGVARVLSTEWIHGVPLADLPQPIRRQAAKRAAEACLVQLLITGLVHADPHEGNLLYTVDGKIAFLDFGLVDRLEPHIMQGFAEAMRSVALRDWAGFAKSMQDINWTTVPMKRNLRPGQVAPRYVDCPFEEFVEALTIEMERDGTAQARLGELVAAVHRLADRYLMQTPSYIALITRTFVTLEGFVSKADPDFNIFKLALPVALRRFASPATRPARAALRESLLAPGGEVRWEALEALLNASTQALRRRRAAAPPGDSGRLAEAPAWAVEFLMDDMEEDPGEDQPGIRPLQGLLGSTQGATVRRLAYEVDMRKLLRFLLQPRAGRLWRQRASTWLADWLGSPRAAPDSPTRRSAADEGAAAAAPSGVAGGEVLGAQWRHRRHRAVAFLVRSHLRRGGPSMVAMLLACAVVLTPRALMVLLARRLRQRAGAASAAGGRPAGWRRWASWAPRWAGAARRA